MTTKEKQHRWQCDCFDCRAGAAICGPDAIQRDKPRDGFGYFRQSNASKLREIIGGYDQQNAQEQREAIP